MNRVIIVLIFSIIFLTATLIGFISDISFLVKRKINKVFITNKSMLRDICNQIGD